MRIRFKEHEQFGWREREIEISDEQISAILNKIFWVKENENQEFLKNNMDKIT